MVDNMFPIKKVNVPEMFYQRFIASQDIPASTASMTTLQMKLANTPAKSRGRGQSRVVENVTEAEWNELYQYAAEGRAHMQGHDRETTLRPAICARALAERMEKKGGIANVVTYVPKYRSTKTVTERAEVDTDLSSVIPTEKPVVDQTADVAEATQDDLDTIRGDIAAAG